MREEETKLMREYFLAEFELNRLDAEKRQAVNTFLEKQRGLKKRRRGILRELQRLGTNTIPDSE